jgi:hypothetical protein
MPPPAKTLDAQVESAEAGAEDPFSGSIAASRRICFKIIQAPLIPSITRHPDHIFPNRHGF